MAVAYASLQVLQQKRGKRRTCFLCTSADWYKCGHLVDLCLAPPAVMEAAAGYGDDCRCLLDCCVKLSFAGKGWWWLIRGVHAWRPGASQGSQLKVTDSKLVRRSRRLANPFRQEVDWRTLSLDSLNPRCVPRTLLARNSLQNTPSPLGKRWSSRPPPFPFAHQEGRALLYGCRPEPCLAGSGGGRLAHRGVHALRAPHKVPGKAPSLIRSQVARI